MDSARFFSRDQKTQADLEPSPARGGGGDVSRDDACEVSLILGVLGRGMSRLFVGTFANLGRAVASVDFVCVEADPFTIFGISAPSTLLTFTDLGGAASSVDLGRVEALSLAVFAVSVPSGLLAFADFGVAEASVDLVGVEAEPFTVFVVAVASGLLD